jgi:hypothetical protein
MRFCSLPMILLDLQKAVFLIIEYYGGGSVLRALLLAIWAVLKLGCFVG